MARFQDLSTELVLVILEEVLPGDIVSVSLASKSIYQLAIPRLGEHRRLQKQYTILQNMVEYKPNNWHDPGGLLAHLLCKILSDARASHYVQRIHLGRLNCRARDGWKPDAVFEKQLPTSNNWLQQASKTNMEIIEEAVRAVEVIPTNEVDEWLYEIRCGNEDPLVALLILYAPKLRTLQFVQPYIFEESPYLFKTIQRIASQASTVKLYLSHLKAVEMYFADERKSLNFVKVFMSVPSLSSIQTMYLYADGRAHETNSAILLQPSTVRQMSFQNGLVPDRVVSELRQGVTNLKSFVYDFQHFWHHVQFTPPFDCLAMLSSLVANASHSLEYLKLGADDIKRGQIAPARRFHALRNIEIRTSRCFAIEKGRPANIVGSLLGSLERLSIRWHEVTSMDKIETLTEAILGLVRESKTQLPRLRMLHVCTDDQGESQALKNCLASDQTAQINPKLSFSIEGPNGGRTEIRAWADNLCSCGQDCFGNGTKCGNGTK